MKIYRFESIVKFEKDTHLTPEYLEWVNDLELQGIISSLKKQWTMQMLEEFVSNQDDDPDIDFFAIIAYKSKSGEGGIHVGNAKLRRSGARIATLSILIGRKEARSCGIGREVVMLMVAFCNEKYQHIEAIEAVVHKTNHKSQRLFKSLSFKLTTTIANEHIYTYSYGQKRSSSIR